jgi:hypothetical protein
MPACCSLLGRGLCLGWWGPFRFAVTLAWLGLDWVLFTLAWFGSIVLWSAFLSVVVVLIVALMISLVAARIVLL